MAASVFNPIPMIIFFSFIIFIAPSPSQAAVDQFIFNGFNNSDANFTFEGASVIKPSGAIRLTNRSLDVIGHVFYNDPVQMFDKTTSSPNPSSFSTYFVFSIVPPAGKQGGYGLAFTISPTKQFPGAQADQYLGIFNSSNDNLTSNHVFAVEFDTVQGFSDTEESEGSHVGININSIRSVASQAASYYTDSSLKIMRALNLENGDSIQAWIEYNGTTKEVHVTIAPPMVLQKPIKPLLSYVVDLSSVFKEQMYVGFSASTGKKSSSHYILGWSFQMNGGAAPRLNLSQLPTAPKEKDSSHASAFIYNKIGVVGLLLFIFSC